MPGRGGDGRTEPRPSPRNKRAEIVAIATEFFGDNGYEDTKWADVASAVGLGPTPSTTTLNRSSTASSRSWRKPSTTRLPSSHF